MLTRQSTVAVVLIVVMLIAALAPATSQGQTQTLMCPSPGFGEVVVPAGPGVPPFIPLSSLKTAPNPILPRDPTTGQPVLRDDLGIYVRNLTAAIRLGKALFWDVQAGSDNKTACATCHFQAGADTRTRNQLHRGANGSWDGYAANHALSSDDFPFTAPEATPPDIDNVAGSQGVRKSTFKGIGKSGAESIAFASDSVFSVGGVTVRQVTDKNAPPVINAVFNHRNFFNGRAQPEFNGVTPFGNRDTSARVWEVSGRKAPVTIDVHIPNASLASQAVGPALNTVEMSAAGRTFPDLGRKLLALKPLGLQKVSPTDSVLGPIADTTVGLRVSYRTLIEQAFRPRWWNSTRTVLVNGTKRSMMEANFSLYWGLAIMLYEATLVSDDTPMDQYLATRVFDLFQLDAATGLPRLVSHDPSRLDAVVNRLALEGVAVTRDEILNGLALFEQPLPLPGTTGFPRGTGVGCSLCHVGAETTSASVQSLTGHGLEPGDVVFKNAGFDLRLERMFTTLPPVPAGTDLVAYDPGAYAVLVLGIDGVPVSPEAAPATVYDRGWYNIGVRPTADDPGLGGNDPFGKPLSWTRLFQALANPAIIDVPGGGLGCATSPPAAPWTSPFAGEVLNPLTGLPLLAGPLHKTEATDVAGTFKVPALRNVELSGPYFHNGGKSTLRQVLELYDAGGDFANATLSPLIRPLGMTSAQIRSLVAFLLALTDERVRSQKAPFDHPELRVPDGHHADGSDADLALPAVGTAGAATPVERFLNLNPFQR